MKMKNVVVAIFCITALQVYGGQKIEIVNIAENPIKVRPWWDGSSNALQEIPARQKGAPGKHLSYEAAGLHRLKKVMWNDLGVCYKAEVGHLTDGVNRFKSVRILIYSGGEFEFVIGDYRSFEMLKASVESGAC